MQSDTQQPALASGSDVVSSQIEAEKEKLKSPKATESLFVLLLSERFEVRGSSTQTLLLAQYLSDYGIRSAILTPSAEFISPDRRRALEIHEYRYLDFPLVKRLILKYIEQDFGDPKPDLIHIQSRRMLADGIRLAKRWNCPYVLTIHDYIPEGEVLNFEKEHGYKIIAVSSSVKSELLTQPNITGDMVTVIHSGVEQIPDEKIRPVLAPGCTPVIGTAGPLEQVKGVSYFLHAVHEVLKVYPELEFLVAGAGPEEHSLRQLVHSLGIEKNVTFVSNLYGFRESLRAMDIFCLPSLQQGLGTIMLEAMACGRPVIASCVGGVFTAITNDETGLLVPPSDSDAIAEKLLLLLEDPELARRIGNAGKEHVRKNFRIDQTVRRVADLYRSCMAHFSSLEDSQEQN